MHNTIALWIAQGLLAAAFLMAGFMKASRPLDALAKSMPWIASAPQALVRFIGVSELLGAIGVVLPAATGILPGLTVAAAIGLALVMVCAAIFHASRREFSNIGVNVILLLLALFVAYGRWGLPA